MHRVPRHGYERAHRVFSTRSASRLSTALHRGAPIDIHPEVQDALGTGKPVVALETALTTHGLPPPINLRVTRDLEAVVRSTGCIPATIGVVAGRVKVGLEASDLERLADVHRTPRSVKISRRDIAPALAMKADGGNAIHRTTISATLIFAALAGIKIFATGGLGGVHRGGETSMDVSADLHELTRCPVGLVSAGVKSILDIGRTLEYLASCFRCPVVISYAFSQETLGVPVVPYSKTKDFPAFFSPRSGFQTPWNVNDPTTAARMLYIQWQLGMENGALIALPIPEEYSEKGEAIQKAVNQAVLESEENGMSKRGKDVTPWLLARVAELTKHDSIDSNVALLRNTALIGGQIAMQYQTLANELNSPTKTYAGIASDLELQESSTSTPSLAKILVVGGAALDITAQSEIIIDDYTSLHTCSTSPGTVSLQLGGVARNIAEACHRLGAQALLISPIGKDSWGRLLHEKTAAIGMGTEGLFECDQRTAVCNLFLDGNGVLGGGVADMIITHTAPASERVLYHIERNNPDILALDANLSSDTIADIVDICVERKIQSFEPTSKTKSVKILPAIEKSLRKGAETPITFFTPNLLELGWVHHHATECDLLSSPAWWSVVDMLSLGEDFRTEVYQLAKRPVHSDEMNRETLAFLVDRGVVQTAVALTPLFRHMFIKCGEKGVLGVIRLSGEDARSSDWAYERNDPSRRYVVAHADSGNEILILQHFPPHPTKVVNSTGAGDSFVGALLASLQAHPHLLRSPSGLEQLVETCQKAAVLTLQSHSSVSDLLNTLA
ncbi:indigoidine synthase A-like protein [Mycena maculata]|uniref:Indigoidine synthase A-like protein n=1 Tax=Mycena maculata TaxID=230809 RepID=A0AAD7KEW1_9AGAR|nr:indigoidine synthase A-like protein [Mycena maculata]